MLTPQNLVSDKPPLRTLMRIVMIVILGFVIIGPLMGLAISSAFYQGDLLNDLQSTNVQPGFLSAILTMQGIVTFVGLILIPLIYLTRLEHKSLRPFFPGQQQLVLILIIVAGIGITFPISISPLAEWNMNIKFPEFMSGFEQWAIQEEERLAKLTTAITDFKSPAELLLGILVIALLPAIGEELVFRGMIQHELWRSTRNIHLAIWTSADNFQCYSYAILWVYPPAVFRCFVRIPVLLVGQFIDSDVFAFFQQCLCRHHGIFESSENYRREYGRWRSCSCTIYYCWCVVVPCVHLLHMEVLSGIPSD